MLNTPLQHGHNNGHQHAAENETLAENHPGVVHLQTEYDLSHKSEIYDDYIYITCTFLIVLNCI